MTVGLKYTKANIVIFRLSRRKNGKKSRKNDNFPFCILFYALLRNPLVSVLNLEEQVFKVERGLTAVLYEVYAYVAVVNLCRRDVCKCHCHVV